MMIISDDQGMWLKITHQELTDIIFRGKLGKFFGKGNNHQIIYPGIRKQFNFFIQGIDQPDTGSGCNDLSRMWIKRDDHRFSIRFYGPFFHLGNHLLMSGMNAIKGSDREYGISKKG